MRGLTLKTATICSVLIVYCAVASTPVMAQDVMTDGLIRAYYNESISVIKRSAKETVDFLERHIADDAVMTIKSTSEVDGTVGDVSSYGKQDVIDYMRDNFSLDENPYKEELVSIDIASDFRTAKIVDKGLYEEKVDIPWPKGSTTLLVTHKTLICESDLILTSENVIQTKKQHCDDKVVITQGADALRQLQASIIKNIQ